MNILNVTNSNFYIKYILSLLFSCQVMSDSLQPHGLQHTRPPCPSPSLRGCPSSCPLNQWCHPTISSFVSLFSFFLQSFPASGYFPISQLFPLGGQSAGASASESLLAMSIQSWFPLGLTGLISLLSRELWRVFSRTTVWKHPMVQLSHPSIPDYWKDHSLDYTNLCQQSYVFAFYTLFRFVMALLPRSNCLLIS